MSEKLLYKVLCNSYGILFSPYREFCYRPGVKYTCDNFCESRSLGCAEGFYATDVDGLIYTFRNLPGYEVWLCAVGGRSVEYDQFKRRYEFITLLEEVPLDRVKELAVNWEPKVGYRLSEALFPINPLLIQRDSSEVTPTEIEWLKSWASVRESVRYSARGSFWGSVQDFIRDSVQNSVRDSVWASVWDSVWNSVWSSVWSSLWDSIWISVWNSVGSSVWRSISGSVRDSVWDSVWAYISSLFFNIKEWKYTNNLNGDNPFQPAINLWKAGLIPSFDGDLWRLHAGKNVDVVWKGSFR